MRFTHELYKQSHGEFGIMAGLMTRVPEPSHGSHVLYGLIPIMVFMLVNGRPRIVNVEDPKLLDLRTMKQSYQFLDTKAQFPRVDVRPGDRDGKIWPDSQPGPNGGVKFTVSYPLRNGCHARACGRCDLDLEFRCGGKISRDFISRDARPAVAVEGMWAGPTTLLLFRTQSSQTQRSFLGNPMLWIVAHTEVFVPSVVRWFGKAQTR